MENENLMKYSWREFLRNPFSLMFYAVCIMLLYLVYYIVSTTNKEKYESLERERRCTEARYEDRENTIHLLEEIKKDK